MQTKNEIHAIIQDLRKVIPSFYSIPVINEEDSEAMNASGLIGAVVITDGPFKNHAVAIRKLEFKNDYSELEIEYNSTDAQGNNVESEELSVVVGNLINYFVALHELKVREGEEALDNVLNT